MVEQLYIIQHCVQTIFIVSKRNITDRLIRTIILKHIQFDTI